MTFKGEQMRNKHKTKYHAKELGHKHHPKKIISIILLILFVPFAVWSLMKGEFTLFFIVALVIYFGQRGMNKVWPLEKPIKTETKDE